MLLEPTPLNIALLSGAVVVFIVARYILKRRSIQDVRGPPSPSWLTGHAVEIAHQKQVGDLEFKWVHDYGTAWRTRGCYGSDVLMVADPKALQYIFHTSGYRFPKPADVNQVNENLFGHGMVSAHADRHQRHRKIMTPAFSATQLRSFLPIFRGSIARLSQRWRDQLQTAEAGKKTVNAASVLANITLGVFFEAAFDYDIDVLEDSDDELVKSVNNLFTDSQLYPPKSSILFKALWAYIPRSILQFVRYLPGREYRRPREFQAIARSTARTLIGQKAATVLDEKATRDVLSVLVHSNAAEDPSRKLDDDEMLSQMATLIIAGHDTTAATLSWLLYELAKRPEDQRRMRDEIAIARAKIDARGDDDFAPSDLDSLEFINAAIKESLRLHPIAQSLIREAERDDVLPLAFPITTRSGEVMSEIPIGRGQRVIASVCAYNRLREVWGQDADAWRPDRFLDGTLGKQTSVGNYANVLTFSGGIRGCIGWRFSVIEMQAILVELVENFCFEPVEDLEVARVPVGIGMVPLVKGKFAEGNQIPLRISLVK